MGKNAGDALMANVQRQVLKTQTAKAGCADRPELVYGRWLFFSLTLVVLTLLPVLQDQPVRSGRTLHSSPSIHGCMWHHHFWATIEAGASHGGNEGQQVNNWSLWQMKSIDLMKKGRNKTQHESSTITSSIIQWHSNTIQLQLTCITASVSK